MTKYALGYGLLAGAVIASLITSTIIFADQFKALHSELVGYLIMLVIELPIIFVGVKKYRDVERGGVVRFGRALATGLGIAVVAGFAYVAVWETYLAVTHYAFMDHYIDGIRHAYEAKGLSGAKLAEAMKPMEEMRVSYQNPLFRLPMTFMEIAPVGLLVALLSAGLLCNPKVLPARR
ncbi:MAG: hypothetical protein JWN66_2714 [Sphingomonas bacterium]|jgi:uncharacterized membrane protein YhaH (DUF805 family)|uniref:DUF4199 domain-containing protein n=1 Tax=Sphingomonas bacterium TaxID=1895847 RepID=UPI002634BC1E|nr:DUF4199 domain-containing protein [Sphingomonas bacterium]MDB5705598.1 hypothetical protein [Sphingomonas bacterium]